MIRQEGTLSRVMICLYNYLALEAASKVSFCLPALYVLAILRLNVSSCHHETLRIDGQWL